MKKEGSIAVLSKEFHRMIQFDRMGCVRCVLLGLLTSGLSLGYTITMREMIEALHPSTYFRAFSLFSVFCVIVVFQDILNGVYNYYLAYHSLKVEKKLRPEFMLQIQNIAPIQFEKPDELDRIEKARASVDVCINTLLDFEILLADSISYIIMITFYLCSIHWALGLVVLLAFVPSFFSYVSKVKIGEQAESESAPQRRKMVNAESAICDGHFYKETRHVNAVDFFVGLFTEAAEKYQRIRNHQALQTFRINFVVDGVYFLSFLATIALICVLAVKRIVSVGDVAAVLSTTRILMSDLKSLFHSRIDGIITHYPQVHNLHEILCIENSQSSAEEGKISDIRFSNLSFTYPGAEIPALSSINLTLHEGETVCVVGNNGSGKSTFAKLLLGLYSPSEGHIEINGKVIGDNQLNVLRKNSSAVFQDFSKYALTLKENISFGSAECDSKFIKPLSKTLSERENTMLSRAFGGEDLSHGQWQKVAIARGISRLSSLIIFDEPTAAIDPALEREFLETMLNEKTHSIKIIITHRIGIATQADRVLVFHCGKLVEDGPHQELVAQGGIYANLFATQGSWYKN